MNKISTLIILLSLISCGKESGSNKRSTSSTPELQEQVAEGNYRAILRPMNNSLSGFLPSGVAEIKISGDEVKVLTLLDDDAKVTHMQSIYKGTRCPIAADDKNKDGVIDISETIQASGGEFIPLDDNLNSAAEGVAIYPVGPGFTYEKSASLSRLESDTIHRMKEKLNLSGRIVIVHGVAKTAKMPDSAATVGSLTKQSSVPVACGVLKRFQ